MNTNIHDSIANFPYPLGLVIQQTLTKAILLEQGESVPSLPFDICRCLGLLLRMDAALAIKAYVNAGHNDAGINIKIIEALRTPTDGIWHELLQTLVLNGSQNAINIEKQIFQDLKNTLQQKLSAIYIGIKNQKKETCIHGLAQLIKYRNDLIHGKRLTDKQHAEALTKLKMVLSAHSFYNKYALLVHHSGKWFNCLGSSVKPLNERLPDNMQDWSAILEKNLCGQPDDCPILFSLENHNTPLLLSPLLHFCSEGSGMDIRFDDIFFVNRVSREAAEFIAYRHGGHFGADALGNYESFRKFISEFHTPNLPKEKRINFYGLYEFHHDRFVGREKLLQEIEETLQTTTHKYIEIRALAGMGKTAIVAELYGKYGTRENLPWPHPGNQQSNNNLPSSQNRWAFHFCAHQDGRDDPLIALQSIVAQLCDGAALQQNQYMSNELNTQREKLAECLKTVASKLHADGRIFIGIDALDEGISQNGNRSIPKALFGIGDKEPEIPENLVFLVSYRIQSNGKNAVENHLRHIPEDWRSRMVGTDPLDGLNKLEVHHLVSNLAKQLGQQDVPQHSLDTIWEAANNDTETGANPLYLRFLGDDILDGIVDLKRPESVPKNLNTVFERAWMSLPSDHDYAVHRMLGTLAILRQYGTDELMQYIVNEARPKDKALSIDEIRSLRMTASKLLVYQGDSFSLFHDKFREFLIGHSRDRLDIIVEMTSLEK